MDEQVIGLKFWWFNKLSNVFNYRVIEIFAFQLKLDNWAEARQVGQVTGPDRSAPVRGLEHFEDWKVFSWSFFAFIF